MRIPSKGERNGLHLVISEPPAEQQPAWYSEPRQTTPEPPNVPQKPLLLHTMWVASLLCYAGVLVWFAN